MTDEQYKESYRKHQSTVLLFYLYSPLFYYEHTLSFITYLQQRVMRVKVFLASFLPCFYSKRNLHLVIA